MKGKAFISLLLTLCLAASLVFGGCHTSINISDDSSTNSSPSSSQAANVQNSQPSKAESQSSKSQASSPSSEAVENSYTMADIKNLNNTQNFAKNTLEHIFDGTINSKGKATGYHYTQIADSKGRLIEGTESGKDAHGVFTGKVEIDGVRKNGFSSFYPENWTPQQVVDAINEAYEDALSDSDNPHGSLWIGYSGDLEIDMYLDNHQKITTAFPIYEGD